MNWNWANLQGINDSSKPESLIFRSVEEMLAPFNYWELIPPKKQILSSALRQILIVQIKDQMKRIKLAKNQEKLRTLAQYAL